MRKLTCLALLATSSRSFLAEPEPEAIPTYGINDTDVVCDSCAPEFLKAKTDAIKATLRDTVERVGDMNPRKNKVFIHLDGDAMCDMAFEVWKKSNMAMEDAFVVCETIKGEPFRCDVCLTTDAAHYGDMAKTLTDVDYLVLSTHEVGHVWWKGREDSYAAEEPMVKMLSYALAGVDDYCTKYQWSSPPDTLVGDLCALGVTDDQVYDIYTSSAEQARKLARAMTEKEFLAVVSGVMRTDLRGSFVKAGIIK